MKEASSLFVAFLAIIATFSAVNCQSDAAIGEWHMLTKHNFSSQIRLHPHILLFVSVPWSGESRSLMKEISCLVRDRKEELRPLKLMYLFRNKDKMLADAIGAFNGITVLYFHHSFLFKYQGRLVADYILSSVVPYFNVPSHEIPVRGLNTSDELTSFVESTDKALLIMEFCGWTPVLLAAMHNNGTENANFADAGGFNGETDGIPAARLSENQKVAEIANSKCDIQDGLGGIPWVGEFSSVNASASIRDADTEGIKPNIGSSSCTYEEFRQFKSFFSRFMNVAREFFLLSERYRFGWVSERSLLTSLGVEDSGSWSTMLYVNGCPSCSKVLNDGDDIKAVLLLDESLIPELQASGQDLDPAVPADRPSVILFVDRFSNSSETKRKSKEALGELRKLALKYQMSQPNGEKSERSSTGAFQEYRSISRHPRLKPSPVAQNLKLQEKMSVMIVNDGKNAILENIASDLHGSSLHEILTYLLQQKKGAKLSSVAKKLGFQLLSDDIDVEVADTIPSEPMEESVQASTVTPEENFANTSVNPGKDSALENQTSEPTGIRYSSHGDEEKKTYVDASTYIPSIKLDQLAIENELANLDTSKADEKGYTQVDQLDEPQLQVQNFNGPFYFSDANYRLLRALTGDSRIPFLVIIDPIAQHHYILPEQTSFSYASLEDILHRFLNGSLTPYQRSESAPENPREGTHPPFVNMDFHEADSIPHVTTRTFSDQVIGFNESGNEVASPVWNEDVVVLFSNHWCGFCLRMELIVREVFRALKGYMNLLKTGTRNVETVHGGDYWNNDVWKLPRILLMDCTLNDCSLIFKSANQREIYPTLLLFPAERKTAVSYEGDMSVASVIKFIANHGSCSQHLTSDKGILSSVARKGGRNHVKDALPSTFNEKTFSRKNKSYEVLLKNRTPKRAQQYSRIKSHTYRRQQEIVTPLAVGSIFGASEKLSVHPFDNSMILLVKVEQNTRFEGIIYNKLMHWDSLDDPDKGFEHLKAAPLSFGGPLVKRGMPLVALTKRPDEDRYPEVVPGIFFLDQSATLHEIEQLKSGNRSVEDYWFFVGFSSWGWDQLYDEIAEGAWIVIPNSTGLLEWP